MKAAQIDYATENYGRQQDSVFASMLPVVEVLCARQSRPVEWLCL